MGADLRFALRILFQRRLFTLASISCLALGIGANTAVFSLMNAVIWRDLPVKAPEQLVRVATGSPDGTLRRVPWVLFDQLRDQRHVFAGVFARSVDGVSLTIDGRTERVVAEIVSGSYFSVLGVEGTLGRMFSPEVEKGQWEPEVVLSYDFWQRRFDRDPLVIGRQLLVNGYPFTVVGVSGRVFFGVEVGSSHEIRLPFRNSIEEFAALPLVRPGPEVEVLGRLAPGVASSQAQIATDSILQRFLAEDVFSRSNPRMRGARIEVASAARGLQRLRSQLERPLTALMFVAGLLLLIACVNVASLQIARALTRSQEIAIRLALGSPRFSLVRLLLVECLALSLLGGLAGFAVAFPGTNALLGFLPHSHLPVVLKILPDMRAMAFAFILSLMVGLLFGLSPAIQATKLDLVGALKNRTVGVMGSSSSGRRIELGQAFLVLQVAVSTVLLVVAGLFVRTLERLGAVAPGFQSENVTLYTMKHVHERYSPEQLRNFYLELLQRVSSLHGVRSAGLSEAGPLSGREGNRMVTVPGSERSIDVSLDRVSPRFFGTLAIPLLLGRDFAVLDREGGRPVAVIDITLAGDLFDGVSPVGRMIRMNQGPTARDYEVVGVVQSVKQISLREPSKRSVYLSMLQGDKPWMPTLYVQSQSERATITRSVLREFERLDPELPVFNVKTMRQQISHSLSSERLTASLSSLFGALGLILVFVGLLGTMGLSVTRRTREIGIRIALGATPADLYWQVIASSVRLLGLGLLFGVPAALAAARLIAVQLFGISSVDPVTLVGVAVVMGLACCLASFFPALQATKVDPIIAVRSE